MAEDLGDRTEAATPRRRQDAREQGDIARSADLTAALILAGALCLLLWTTPRMMRDLAATLRGMLAGDQAPSLTDGGGAMHELAAAFLALGRAAGPFLAFIFLLAYVASVWQVGWLFTLKPLQPRWSKMNPLNGLKRFAGLQTFTRAGMSMGKVALLAGIAALLAARNLHAILALPRFEFAEMTVHAAGMVVELCWWLIVALLLLGVLDLAFQKWNWERTHRMTKQELKEELRTTMGDPMLRQRQRVLARKMMSQRLKQSVPTADVVVTNPEHLAIALKWDPNSMNAPTVVAKGADYLALRIRQIAAAHGVPIVERKPLARAMYPVVQVGREIPSHFYQAIAEILAYVYRLNGKKAA